MPHTINKIAVADCFSKAAQHYDQFAQLQRDIGHQLLNQVTDVSPNVMVDLGCGTGYFSEKLAMQFPTTALICFDLSDAMLAQTKMRNITHVQYQQGDIDRVPFSNDQFDLIFSNLVVQWSADFSLCLQQLKESLTSGGVAHLSTLLDGTLNELSQAWKIVDNRAHINQFLTLSSLQKILNQAGFSSVSLKTETRSLEYENVLQIMRALKGIGASHVHDAERHPNSISGRKLITELERGYQPFVNENGKLTLTYEVCYIEVIK